MRPIDFFAAHPVFRFEGFVAAHSSGGGRSRQTSSSVLKQHVAAGDLLHVRQGLYGGGSRTKADGESPEALVRLTDPLVSTTSG
ncbi:MAG: hypothetical protein ACE5F1_17470 [Planctomycetota bacterium]